MWPMRESSSMSAEGEHMTEGKRLAEFSDVVRESTLKRLTIVPPGAENWKMSEDSMSFADIAQHLIDADRWLFKMLKTKNLPRMLGVSGAARIKNRDEYLGLVEELKQTQHMRRTLLELMPDEDFDVMMHDERFGNVSAWWVIVRGNLDHEIHHRGQLVAYLKMAK